MGRTAGTGPRSRQIRATRRADRSSRSPATPTGRPRRGSSRPQPVRSTTSATEGAPGTRVGAPPGTAGARRTAGRPTVSPLARQVAALGLALCAVALSLAYPLRNYLQQQAAEAAAIAERAALEEQVVDLTAQQRALTDPAYIRVEAKRRLHYVDPDQTVYVIALPPSLTGGGDTDAAADAPGEEMPAAHQPWYATLWDTLTDGADSPGTGEAATGDAPPAHP